MSTKYSRYLASETQSAIILPFPISRSRKIECSYDHEADIYSSDSRFLPGWWILPVMATSLTFCVWAATQLI